MKPILPVDARFDEGDAARVAELARSVVSSGRLTQGPLTDRLESMVCELTGRMHAIAVCSGTAALEVMFRAAQAVGLLPAGGEVMIPANTFAATATAAVRAGLRIRTADCAPGRLDADQAAYRMARTPDTRAVCLVHIGGGAAGDVPDIVAWCREQGLVVFEDMAHALGTVILGRPAGSFGLCAAVSLYPTKIATAGEGGVVLTDDGDLARVARSLRDHGKAEGDHNLHVLDGYNWRMSELEAAVGLVSLSGLTGRIAKRCTLAGMLTEGLAPLTGRLDPIRAAPGVVPNHYKYACLLAPELDRLDVTQRLATQGIICGGTVYAVPLHRQPILASRLLSACHPHADDMCTRHLCLPLHQRLTVEDIERITGSVRAVLG